MTIDVGIIGTGWCGGIRAVAAAASPLVDRLHLAEIREDRLAEGAALTGASRSTVDWTELIDDPSIDARASTAELPALPESEALDLDRLRGETGTTIRLALEPEPCCALERTEEALAFFAEHLS